jgi:hypothetical protein
MAAAQNRQSTSIEFVVRPKEDLYLEGSLRKLPRVERGIDFLMSQVLNMFLFTYTPRFLNIDNRSAISLPDAEEPDI